MGEEEVKYRPDAIIPVKVNGEVKELTLQELISTSSSELHAKANLEEAAKRVESAEQIKTQLQEETQKISKNIESVMSKLESDKPFEVDC